MWPRHGRMNAFLDSTRVLSSTTSTSHLYGQRGRGLAMRRASPVHDPMRCLTYVDCKVSSPLSNQTGFKLMLPALFQFSSTFFCESFGSTGNADCSLRSMSGAHTDITF